MIFDAIRRWFGSGGDRPGGDGASGDAAGPPGSKIPCEEALARLYEYLDGELDGLTRDQVEAHFRVCRLCYPHLAGERAFKAALRRAVEGREAPPELKSRVVELLDGVADGA